MVDFDTVILRADVPELEQLIGRPAVRLLQILDPELVRVEPLRKILSAMRPASALLLEQPAWNEIVDLLRDTEAEELADLLAASGGTNAWDSLKTTSLRRSSRNRDAAFAFFGLGLPTPTADDSVLSLTRVNPTYSLFEHQRKARHATEQHLKTADPRVVLHMPTGSGKTRTAMHLIANHLSSRPRAVVIWLAYSEELCEQAAAEFEQAWRSLGDRSIEVVRFWGEYESDLSSCHDGLIVAGLAKTYSRALGDIQFIARLAEEVSLIVIDEAHQAVAESYSLVLNALRAKRPMPGLLGLTATPGRSWDDIDEDRKLAEFFGNSKVTLAVKGYENPIDYLIDRGYLARPAFRTLTSHAGSSLSDRDFDTLETALDVPKKILSLLGEDEQRNLLVLAEVEKLADSHKRILVFAASVEGALILSTALEAHGRVRSRSIDAGTPMDARRRVIQWYKAESDECRVLCNYGVLTTGFDAPKTSAAIVARPTKSLVLYSQMIGRALRGSEAGGNTHAEIVTVIDIELPGFRDLGESFMNWEDAGWQNRTT